MKKTLLILAAIVFSLTACDKQTYEDGIYKVTFDQADTHGWTAFLEFNLTADELSDVDFDYLDADGNRKSLDTAYANNMFPVAGTSPDLFCPELETRLQAATIVPEFEPVDAVSGATGSSEDANHLMEVGLEWALSGEPMTGTTPQTDVEE